MTIRRDALLGFAPVAVLAGGALMGAGLILSLAGLSWLIERVGEAQED